MTRTLIWVGLFVLLWIVLYRVLLPPIADLRFMVRLGTQLTMLASVLISGLVSAVLTRAVFRLFKR